MKKTDRKLSITIGHDAASIDPAGVCYPDEMEIIIAALESNYTRAIRAEYPGAEIQFKRVFDKTRVTAQDESDLDAIKADINRILSDVFDTGLFWL